MTTEVARKLIELGYHTFREMERGVEALPGSELKRLGIVLPDDYSAFLAEFPETGMFDRQVGFRGREPTPWNRRTGVAVLETLYGRCDIGSFDIISVRHQYLEDFGPSYLAIGEVRGVNKVCLSCAGRDRGQIYVWDHEHFGDPRDAFYPAFDSFSDLINGLFEYEDPPTKTRLVEEAPPESFMAQMRNFFKIRK
jgi:hypothetical protein